MFPSHASLPRQIGFRNIPGRLRSPRSSVNGDTEMGTATYFLQECPTCGRSLEIRVEHLGKQVVCQHCRGSFAARDPDTGRGAGPRLSLLERADELIELADSFRLPR